jgi:diaminohydroxyphosphoribosylaminopyrimidine deaminase/5-amino-6-(5-phosphoribosylamino)uracil reductase
MEPEAFMQRCLQLALNGSGRTAPNPLVGAVLVRNGHVLAEGWHRALGGPHAEVECLRAFGEGTVPADAVLYVNLEPCAHTGRTPPCADLLIARGVKHVVVGCSDPNPLVAGKGIQRLRDAGVQVQVDLLRDACRWTNRRFITCFEQQRPYVVLKWARSLDGFLDDHGRTVRISSPATDVLVHRWRAEEQAILVGSGTVLNDDPALTVRHVHGASPLRVVLDRSARIPAEARVFDGSTRTLLFTGRSRSDVQADQCVIDTDTDPVKAVLAELHRRSVRSLLVEGGARLLAHFIAHGPWDEARVITGARPLGDGSPAPRLAHPAQRVLESGGDRISLHTNATHVHDTWSW